ncbi:MAG TPA: rhodanese-like domain-containing protein [Gemmatimonadaceae bacterium]|nr:rhodanese-like domain-containing protein [Gemmatimonadaceae bacterium]
MSGATGARRRRGGRPGARFATLLATLLAAALSAAPAAPAAAQGGAPAAASPLPLVRLSPSVYAVLGDTGRGSEGRPNAGFVVADSGVVVIDALATPREGEQLLAAIRSVTAAPVRWLVLTHHHPDHHFGAIALRRAGARVIAHPDRRTLASEAGDTALVREWTAAMGAEAMRGFALADSPDVAVARDTVLRPGGRAVALLAVPGAHTAGDLMAWLPDDRILFAGDILIEDGVSMVVDGSSAAMLAALDRVDSLRPRVAVPGHGRLAAPPDSLVARTRCTLVRERERMRAAIEEGTPMTRVLARMPPADRGRPVSRASRERRNAVRIYEEMERALFQQGTPAPAADPRCTPSSSLRDGAPGGGAPPDDVASRVRAPVSLISTERLAALVARDSATVIDARTDIALYLRSHIPGAVYLNTETLRSADGGVPNLILPAGSYRALFTRLGVRPGRPVAVYSAGDTRNVDATYVTWLLAAFGQPVYVVDGGFARWELESRPTERRYPKALPGRFEGASFAPERATLDDVRRAIAPEGSRAGMVLVDARVAEQYEGKAGAQMRRGHIPGAVSHYWQGDLTEGELAKVWKAPAALRASYAAQGITPDRDIIVYCNGGLESSHVWFALRYILGYPRVRVYDGSFTEWAAREELPVATGGGARD